MKNVFLIFSMLFIATNCGQEETKQKENTVRIKTPTKRKSYLQTQGQVGDVFRGL